MKRSVALNADDAVNWDMGQGIRANDALYDVCDNTQASKRFPVDYLNCRVIDKAILRHISYDYM